MPARKGGMGAGGGGWDRGEGQKPHLSPLSSRNRGGSTACQAPLSMGFFRQEYWSGLRCPPPGDLSDPGIEPTSLASPALAGGSFTTCTTWEDPTDACPESSRSHQVSRRLPLLLGLVEEEARGAGARCQPAVFLNFPLSGRGAAVSVRARPRLQGKDAHEPQAAEAHVGMSCIKCCSPSRSPPPSDLLGFEPWAT